ncbi:alpha/beta fold hydrolase [Rubellicoccus peritrichatus]|uniref:Alpha/beta fold hydrolase n=1 Tax=Rubellicoccus peritrichatus TaxID=3080537 RepID=A0AAQ3QU41_9BACT|nr:alpha/beta fold hydrolase [Puniceicoccus sp. CR14]WOO39585.1 alpha/beta fold hydrolase [Puniceicoccus sp. CR14]
MEKLPDHLKKLYPFTSNWIDTPGGKQHYVDEGEGEVVVMLHGNPTWSFFYRNLIKELSQNYRCIVPDHIGMGLSDKPQKGFNYQLSDHIENVVRLLEHLKVERFNLIVHDWGGAIGMGLAERFPNRVGKIVVMNTAAFRSQNIPKRIAICKLPIIGEFIVRGFNGFAWPATWMASRKKLSLQVKAGYLFPYHDWKSRIATHRFVQDIPLSEKHPSYATLLKVEQSLSKFQNNRMLLLWGIQDFCFDDTFLREWQKRFPKAETVELSNAGHYLLEDAPDETLERIQAFLAQ